MKMKRRTCLRIVTALLLTVLVTAGLYAPVSSTYAGGSARVTIAYDGIKDGTEFTLKLYKIGSWTHQDGKAVLAIDSPLASAAKVPSVLVYEDESDAEALLETSNVVGNYIKSHSSDFTPVGTKTAAAGDESGALFGGLEDDGLYIVTGDTAVDGKKRWTPKSVFIDILNSDKSMTINMVKLESSPIIDQYTVVKIWDVEDEYKDKEAKARPASVDVEISYGDIIVDTVTLNKDNNWSYTWDADESESDKVVYSNSSHEKEGSNVISASLNDDNGWSNTFELEEDHDRMWHVTEVSDEGNIMYDVPVVEEPSESNPSRYQIINRYNVTELEIIKTLDGYVDAGSSSNITVAFKIRGMVGEDVVYNNTAGLTFEVGDELTKKAIVKNIPGGLDSIEVEEVYAAGYSVKDGEKTKTLTKDDIKETGGVWRFEFENEPGPGRGSGVVNKYEDGKYVKPSETAAE